MRLSDQECLLLLQRTSVWLPTPTSASTQLPRILAPRLPMPYAGLSGQFHTYTRIFKIIIENIYFYFAEYLILQEIPPTTFLRVVRCFDFIIANALNATSYTYRSIKWLKYV